MSDSDGSSQQDNRHRRLSRSRSRVSPGCAGETLGEREERRLAEAAVLVGPSAGQPRAAPAVHEPLPQEPVPAEESAPAAQAAATAVPTPEEAPRAQSAETASLASRAATPAGPAAAPGTPLARGAGPARPPSASPAAAPAAAKGREGAQYRAQTRPSHTHTSPPKPYPPKAAFLEGRPRPVCPPRAHAYDAGNHAAAAAAATGRPARDPGAGGRREGGVGYRPRERGARDGGQQAERPRTNAGDRRGHTRQVAITRAQARHQGQRQRRRAERERWTTRHGTQHRETARAREGHGREQQRPRTDART